MKSYHTITVIVPLLAALLTLGGCKSGKEGEANKSTGSAAAYVAKFTSNGELVRPEGYREWVYVGTPVTPNDMNNGNAPFPEFHNVYIAPAHWQHYKKTGKFPDGTVLVKELISVGSKQATKIGRAHV